MLLISMLVHLAARVSHASGEMATDKAADFWLEHISNLVLNPVPSSTPILDYLTPDLIGPGSPWRRFKESVVANILNKLAVTNAAPPGRDPGSSVTHLADFTVLDCKPLCLNLCDARAAHELLSS